MGGCDTYNWDDIFQIIQCKGCETVSFRKLHTDSEHFEQINAEGFVDYTVTEEIFPSPIERRNEISDAWLIPYNLQKIYSETVKALNSDLAVLAGIGIRAVIEAVCKEKNAQGRDLSSQIDHLVSTGVLTADGAQILHKLRMLGNQAAHEVKPHKTQQLELAMNVIDHLLLGVYVLPNHAKTTFK